MYVYNMLSKIILKLSLFRSVCLLRALPGLQDGFPSIHGKVRTSPAPSAKSWTDVNSLDVGSPSLVFPQGANLAHRAGQLLQKQYLIIHPTADGKDLRQSVAPY